MKKIIVFGASGEIGRYLCKYFISKKLTEKYEIIAIGSRNCTFFNDTLIKYIRVDIRKSECFEIIPKDNVYAVVDLAGAMPARMKGYDPQLYIDVNIIGTLNILEFCRLNKVDRILFTQSFGDIKDHSESSTLLKVDLPRKFSFCNDHSVYVMTKNFAVDLIENYHQMYGIKNFIFRLPTIYMYSPIETYYVNGSPKKIGYRLLIHNAVNGNDIEIWGDPLRVKDMVYVKDLCQILYLALKVERDNGYYNVGTGIGTTLLDQIKGIIEIFSSEDNPSKIIYRPDLPNAPQYIMDIASAVTELGYKPKYDYLSMLKDIKDEMQKNE